MENILAHTDPKLHKMKKKLYTPLLYNLYTKGIIRLLLYCVESIDLLPPPPLTPHTHRYRADFCLVLVLQENWVLAKSRILVNLVLRGVRVVALSLNSHEQTERNQISCFQILFY